MGLLDMRVLAGAGAAARCSPHPAKRFAAFAVYRRVPPSALRLLARPRRFAPTAFASERCVLPVLRSSSYRITRSAGSRLLLARMTSPRGAANAAAFFPRLRTFSLNVSPRCCWWA